MDPFPSSLCTQIRPPCSSMNFRQRIVDINAIRRRSPVRGRRPHDVICQTQTPPTSQPLGAANATAVRAMMVERLMVRPSY